MEFASSPNRIEFWALLQELWSHGLAGCIYSYFYSKNILDFQKTWIYIIPITLPKSLDKKPEHRVRTYPCGENLGTLKTPSRLREDNGADWDVCSLTGQKTWRASLFWFCHTYKISSLLLYIFLIQLIKFDMLCCCDGSSFPSRKMIQESEHTNIILCLLSNLKNKKSI